MKGFETKNQPESLDLKSNPFKLDNDYLKEFVKDIDVYRFVRVGDEIYVANEEFDHRSIIDEFKLEVDSVSDAGFFIPLLPSRIKVTGISAYIAYSGTPEQAQRKNRPQTVNVLQSKLASLGIEFIVQSEDIV